MKKSFVRDVAVFGCFVIMIFSLALSSGGEYLNKNFCGNVLRFHVIANSDSDEDIIVKNKLAEGLTPYTEEKFSNCKDFSEAKRAAFENRDDLQKHANEILSSFSVSERATVFVSEKDYEERILDGTIYPRGRYMSVRVVIGKGKGHNWWCVLFSPLTDVGIERGEDAGEKDVKVRLKIMDLIFGRESLR